MRFKRVLHDEDDFQTVRNEEDGKTRYEGSLACYSPEQAELILACDKYQKKFLSIFPPPGCTGWLSHGVCSDRMEQIKKEIENREAIRCQSA